MILGERTISHQGQRESPTTPSNNKDLTRTLNCKGWTNTDQTRVHTKSVTKSSVPILKGIAVKNSDYNQELMILREIHKQMINAKVPIPSMRNLHPSFSQKNSGSSSLKDLRQHQQQQIKDMVIAKQIKKQPYTQVSLTKFKAMPTQQYRLSIPKHKGKVEGDWQPQSASFDPLDSKNWNYGSSSKTRQWHSMIQKIKSAAAKYKKMAKNSAFLIHRVKIDQNTRAQTRQKSRKWLQNVNMTSKPVKRKKFADECRGDRATSAEEGLIRDGIGLNPWNFQDSNIFDCQDWVGDA